jgi:hypothetical protein
MKRKDGEDFDKYQARRAQANFALNYYLKYGGDLIWDSKTNGQYVRAKHGEIGHRRG